MKNKAFLFTTLTLVAAVVIFFSLKGYMGSSPDQGITQANNPQQNGEEPQFSMVPANPSLLIRPHSPIKGDFAAKVTIVEFLDPECEACSAMYPIVKKIMEEFGKDVKLVVRYMTFHGNSNLVANILESARTQNKYWETLELLFKTQGQWADHHNPRPDLLPEILKPLGLNMEKIVNDANNGVYNSQIQQDYQDGEKLGVRATPTFFVNGQKLEDMGYEPLRNLILEKLDSKN